MFLPVVPLCRCQSAPEDPQAPFLLSNPVEVTTLVREACILRASLDVNKKMKQTHSRSLPPFVQLVLHAQEVPEILLDPAVKLYMSGEKCRGNKYN